jgi:hypothetical protein
MTTTAQSIIRRAVEIAQDVSSIRWPISEVCRYYNDAQREIVLQRPDAMATNAALTLAAGSKQALPAQGIKLIEVVRNTAGGAVRLTNREVLDAQIPGWHTLTGVTAIKHFMYDARDPKTFYVYPPAAGAGASLDIVYAANPTDIAEAADGGTFSTVATTTFAMPEFFAGPMVDYILYRMYSKDADYAGNAARAQAHYAAFANALGLEIKATVMVAPTSPGNPNRPGASSPAPQA